ncbi:MAG TPA: cytochrome c biogenesis protein CcsA [Spirochaetota bacterium]|nr:cytochrome c biogenesis protein CcsA [Spirochaetota bacterium]HPS85817.1 cytochrome c biogenesis protein CcsA [Spirochaetota bacterium]
MNIGNIILSTALMLSLASVFFMIRSVHDEKKSFLAGQRIFYITGILIVFTVLLLFNSFMNNEFQYAYVFNNSSMNMPVAYKIAAMWAGNEGSFLIWLLILNICGIIAIRKTDEFTPILLTSVAIAQIFILLILLVKSPFAYVWNFFPGDFKLGEIPGDGSGMNPLLMDPWMIAHPPILFLGYASSTIPFGYAIAALIRGEYDSWVKKSYPWVIFSMLTLGVGIFMGGYWAYKVLGWGGYWGWDPVENSSLIPWLVSVALMHGLMLQSRKQLLKRTNIVMALSYFILVFFSTFLTRSGVLSEFSVHSFGKSSVLYFLLANIIFFVGVSGFLFIKRYKQIESKKFSTDIFTFEGMTVYGIIVLLLFSFIILAGTTMPIITGLFNSPANVTENFYNNISIPFGIMILSFIILSAFTIRKYEKSDIIIAAIFSITTGVLFNIFATKNPAAILFSVLSFFLSTMIFLDLKKNKKGIILSSRIAHLGVAIFVLGVISSNLHSWSEQKQVTVGETVQAGSKSITLKGFKEEEKSHVLLSISENGKTADARMAYYIDPKTESLYREPYIITGITGDIYITPQQYNFASVNFSSAMLHENDEKNISGYKVKFYGFISNSMGSQGMAIRTDLMVNGKKYFPGIKFNSAGDTEKIDQRITGTDKTISIESLDATHRSVRIFITPGKDAVIPPDYAILEISHKKFIWVVWLGTILIAAGFVISLIRIRR